jgi:MerR family transcriptional regulator, light-induced transcriptional regulator
LASYSISDLEKLSGIKAHTLRIWEQRYKLITPERSHSKIRNYNVADLKLLLNIATLKDHGYKISKIASYSHSQISQRVLEISDSQLNYPDQIQALTTAMVDLDEPRFEQILNANVSKHGFENTMVHAIYPFMQRIGTLWLTGSIGPGQEHFMSNLIRQKLIYGIEQLPKVQLQKAKSFMLFLPEGEYHEISLLFSQYLIKSRGHKVVYLGQSLPNQDVLHIYQLHQPQYIFVSVTTSPNAEQLPSYLNWLAQNMPQAQLLLTGYQVLNSPMDLPKSAKIMAKVDDLLSIIN